MSKKKAASGSTMSLKDFHGGSIPSDLPLPSAPGVVARSGFDRNASTTWGNNMMRPDHRSWPKSTSAAVLNLDERATFLSQPAPIGRNFDEDERKPLDGLTAPRRTISDARIHASAPICQDSFLDYSSSSRVADRQVPDTILQSHSLGTGPSPVRSVRGSSAGDMLRTPIGNHGQDVNNSQMLSGNNGQSVNSIQPNAWGMRKEMMSASEAVGSSVSKFAQASALEKVSAGMWQSKKPSLPLPHCLYARDDNVSEGTNVIGERGDFDASRKSQAERSLSLPSVTEERVQGGVRELQSYEKQNTEACMEEVQGGASNDESLFSPVASSELSERPKLKLLPRSRPLEALDNDSRQGCPQAADAGKVESLKKLNGQANTLNMGQTVPEGGSKATERLVERPKLNLKPRSQPVEKSDGSLEVERKTLFGGARPRELVLKERGIDDITVNDLDPSPSPNRSSSSRKESPSEHLVPAARLSQKPENVVVDKRVGRSYEKKNQRMGHEKDDMQRNGQNRKWRNNRDAEKHLPQQQGERHPEPDTWRKPIEEPKPVSSNVNSSGIGPGKVASALELAQAFSKSVSTSKTQEQYSARRGVAPHNQMPFSRLTVTQEIYSSSAGRHRIDSF